MCVCVFWRALSTQQQERLSFSHENPLAVWLNFQPSPWYFKQFYSLLVPVKVTSKRPKSQSCSPILGTFPPSLPALTASRDLRKALGRFLVSRGQGGEAGRGRSHALGSAVGTLNTSGGGLNLRPGKTALVFVSIQKSRERWIPQLD